MLTFVGLGLYDERSITLQGRDAIQTADDVFAEQYTSRLAGASIEDLEAAHDVVIAVRDRAGVEADPEPILAAARNGDAAVLVGGDPMVSTTHVDLRLRAAEHGIDTQIVHGTTAQTAACSLTGLQNYRFGKATTLPFPKGHGGSDVPDSVLDTIRDNRERDLHTLVYLDIDASEDRYLRGEEAAGQFAEAGVSGIGVVVARAGSNEPLVRADRLAALAGENFGPPLHLLVLPGTLHEMETAALSAFADLPTDLSG